MTHPMTNDDPTFEPRSTDRSNAVIAAIVARPPNDDPEEITQVDQSGRPLGPRAMRTRARILEATVEILKQKSMRDLRVIDIARYIGSSPATFYQYFKDVNDVVLELATEVSGFTPEMIDQIHGDWTGRSGYERGVRLMKSVIAHWDRYRPILRVRNNAADEGDPDFMEVRRKAMFPLVNAFADVIRKARAEAGQPEEGVGTIHPISGGMFLFNLLEGAAIHREIFVKRFEPMGEGEDVMIESVAATLQKVLTSPV